MAKSTRVSSLTVGGDRVCFVETCSDVLMAGKAPTYITIVTTR